MRCCQGRIPLVHDVLCGAGRGKEPFIAQTEKATSQPASTLALPSVRCHLARRARIAKVLAASAEARALWLAEGVPIRAVSQPLRCIGDNVVGIEGFPLLSYRANHGER